MPDSPRTFRLDALILKHMDYGEADRIVVVFSKERGKVRAIAKGVRKLHSRKAGHLEPFTNVASVPGSGQGYADHHPGPNDRAIRWYCGEN